MSLTIFQRNLITTSIEFTFMGIHANMFWAKLSAQIWPKNKLKAMKINSTALLSFLRAPRNENWKM